MGVVLPGVADAAVHLDHPFDHTEERRKGVARCNSCHQRGLVPVDGQPSGVPGGGRGHLGLYQHVGAVVLDRLKSADGLAELFTDLGVGDGQVDAGSHRTDCFCGGDDGDHAPRRSSSALEPAGDPAVATRRGDRRS